MNFFESQDTAKRNTGKLIFLFVLAVLSLIIVTNLLIMFVLGFAGTSMSSMATVAPHFSWQTFLMVGVIVTAIVLLGSLYKISALSGGGARVAEMMKGRLLVSGSRDLHEQRVLNVVEEMAIASGTPVPPVYLLEESGINAFAAGYTPSDAVIGVTRGTIETLNREQLQGVIAHEFSHILHGDMRINIRLIGILHGIMVLGLIGYHLMRSSAYTRRSKNSSGIVLLGLGLVVVGFVGTFFGNLIKAGVSRQREYLADASAVQYTRNPAGIAGALMQIAQHEQRSYLTNPDAAEISHALFEEGSRSFLSGLYATHPPLEKRIIAILPSWDGNFAAKGSSSIRSSDSPATQQTPSSEGNDRVNAILTGAAGVLLADAMLGQVGNPELKHIQHAERLVRQIPKLLLDAAREPSGARAVIYALVIDRQSDIRQRQIKILQDHADTGVLQEFQKIDAIVISLKSDHRLPLVSIALSSLRQLSENQYKLFKQNFNLLIEIDKKINLFEWALQKIVFHHLESVFEPKRSTVGTKDIKEVRESIVVLLSILAHSNKQNAISTADAFAKGAALLGLDVDLRLASAIDFETLNESTDTLARLKPLQKPALLKACAACIMADKEVAPVEAELLRAIAATIDCPMPPLVV